MYSTAFFFSITSAYPCVVVVSANRVGNFSTRRMTFTYALVYNFRSVFFCGAVVKISYFKVRRRVSAIFSANI